jgi:hypothetical protein
MVLHFIFPKVKTFRFVNPLQAMTNVGDSKSNRPVLKIEPVGF